MNATWRCIALALGAALIVGISPAELAGETLLPGALSISLSPRLDPPPTPSDLLDAINLAYNAGARGDYRAWTWRELEPSAGTFNLAQFRDEVNYLGATRGFLLLIGISVLNTTAKETPPDLVNVPFDAPAMKARFRAFINALLPYLSRQVVYLAIGTEVDVYLATHPGEWSTYKSFYDDAVAYVHTVAPWIKVGVTATFDGASGAQGQNVATLTASSDVYILTYYPLGLQFVTRGAGAPTGDFPKMLALAGSRPLILQEVGLPSSELLGGSEQQQADFVTNVFAAWQAAGGRIPFLNFFLLHDFTPAICDDLAQYYGLSSDVNFRAYLCSLGLRRADGTPKLGWKAFTDGAASGVSLRLTINKRVFVAGDTLEVNITGANPAPARVVDVFFGAIAPPQAGAAVGCSRGDAIVLLGNGFTTTIVTCLSAALQSFAPLIRGASLPAALSVTTVPRFFSFVWSPSLPPGSYVFFVALTLPGALADGRLDPGDLLATGTDSVSLAP